MGKVGNGSNLYGFKMPSSNYRMGRRYRGEMCLMSPENKGWVVI